MTTCCGFDCDATTDANDPTDEGWLGMPDGQALCVDCRAECADASDDDFDEPMDGDHETALASAGFGTDEDYGFWGTDDY